MKNKELCEILNVNNYVLNINQKTETYITKKKSWADNSFCIFYIHNSLNKKSNFYKNSNIMFTSYYRQEKTTININHPFCLLPIQIYTENTETYLNLEGKKQQTTKTNIIQNTSWTISLIFNKLNQNLTKTIVLFRERFITFFHNNRNFRFLLILKNKIAVSEKGKISEFSPEFIFEEYDLLTNEELFMPYDNYLEKWKTREFCSRNYIENSEETKASINNKQQWNDSGIHYSNFIKKNCNHISGIQNTSLLDSLYINSSYNTNAFTCRSPSLIHMYKRSSQEHYNNLYYI